MVNVIWDEHRIYSAWPGTDLLISGSFWFFAYNRTACSGFFCLTEGLISSHSVAEFPFSACICLQYGLSVSGSALQRNHSSQLIIQGCNCRWCCGRWQGRSPVQGGPRCVGKGVCARHCPNCYFQDKYVSCVRVGRRTLMKCTQ